MEKRSGRRVSQKGQRTRLLSTVRRMHREALRLAEMSVADAWGAWEISVAHGLMDSLWDWVVFIDPSSEDTQQELPF